MAVLITGAAGFIGSNLADRLLSRGTEVVGLDNFDAYYDPAVKRKNLTRALENDEFHLVEGDIRDEAALSQAFDYEEISHVVHLAARAGVRASIQNPHLYADVNVNGTIRVLDASIKHKVHKLIFGSSSSVYGMNAKLPFSEDDPVERPVSPYAATKRAGELVCFAYHHLYQLPVCCLRFFTVYGPRQRPEMAIHKFTRLIDEGEELPFYGDGTSRRDYTFISDILDGIEAAMNLDCAFEIINLGDSAPVELSQLVSIIENTVGNKANIKPLPDQPGDVPVTYADISKAARLLDYAPQVPLLEGVARFVKWYHQQRNHR